MWFLYLVLKAFSVSPMYVCMYVCDSLFNKLTVPGVRTSIMENLSSNEILLHPEIPDIK